MKNGNEIALVRAKYGYYGNITDMWLRRGAMATLCSEYARSPDKCHVAQSMSGTHGALCGRSIAWLKWRRANTDYHFDFAWGLRPHRPP